MSKKLTELNISEAINGMKKRSFSSTELTKAYLDAIDQASQLNCYIEVLQDQAVQQAQTSDLKYQTGNPGKLEGIPLGIKDLFCVKGVKTSAGSHILDSFIAPYESTVTGNLWSEGAVHLGKLNMDEFAMGSSNETSYYGSVINPWKAMNSDQDLTPGGSSGGSSAAVSAHLCVAATGTDTGGSIRQPAALTGNVGFKPTYGRCSRWGIIAFASSLDQAGPITRTVRDAALMLSVMGGYDPKDSTSINQEMPDLEKAIERSPKGLRIGIPKEYFTANMPDEMLSLFEQGKEWLKNAGCEIVEISLPNTKYALPAYYIIAPAEASSNLARYDGMRYGFRSNAEDLKTTYQKTRSEGFGDEVKRRIMIGTYVLSAGYYDAYYKKALKVRRRIAMDFDEAYQKCDIILTPTTPSSAFPLGSKSDNPVEMYLNDIFTVTANIVGLPAVSVPAGLDQKGLPLGLQLIGRALDEETLFSVANALEKSAGFKQRPQNWWSKSS